MKRIVVGVDGSPASVHAVQMAAELARGLDAHLMLVHAKRPILISPEGREDIIEALHLHAEQESNHILEEAVRTAEAAGATADIRAPDGPSADILVDIAEQEHALLLVVGSRGRGAVARVMLGSTADRVVHVSKVPVLVVH